MRKDIFRGTYAFIYTVAKLILLFSVHRFVKQTLLFQTGHNVRGWLLWVFLTEAISFDGKKNTVPVPPKNSK